MLCVQHHTNSKKQNKYNSDRCKLCGVGGSMLCCDGCPAAFHPACLDEDVAEDGQWFCSDCTVRCWVHMVLSVWQAGRRVLCGDVVWGRSGNYRLCATDALSLSCGVQVVARTSLP